MILDFGRREIDPDKSAIKSEIGSRKSENPTESAHLIAYSDFRFRTSDFNISSSKVQND